MGAFLEPNDYFEIKRKHYDQFVSVANVSADFSGWEHSPDAPFPSISARPPSREDLNRYYADSARRLEDFKQPLRQLLCSWEMEKISYDEFSLLPSTTIAMTLIIAVLEERGVKKIIFDTPLYFAALENVKSRGWEVEFVKPVDVTTGRLDIERIQTLLCSDDTCLWLHQPRYSIGVDLRTEDLESIAVAFQGNRFLVIDEANDDSFPSGMRQALRNVRSEKLFRIKSLVKPFGLNGINMAFILHHGTHREDLVDNMWRLGGTLDYYSLDYIRQLATPPSFYQDLLLDIRSQLAKRRDLISDMISSENSRLLPATTGFLSAIRMRLPGNLEHGQEARNQLVGHFARHRIPVMLGAHIYMPHLPGHEHIRVNLFNSEDDIIYSCSVIREFLAESF